MTRKKRTNSESNNIRQKRLLPTAITAQKGYDLLVSLTII